MNNFYNYAVAVFSSGIWFCKAPFGCLIKPGDLVDIAKADGRGEVLAVEMATENNTMLNLLAEINYSGEAEKITAVYSKKEIEWKEEEKND